MNKENSINLFYKNNCFNVTLELNVCFNDFIKYKGS